MRRRPSASRLTWNPELQFPFESGWSLFRKVKILNNLNSHELHDLVARPNTPVKKIRLRDCAESSWIDFGRFSELLEVSARELKNGFWDQHNIGVVGGDRSTSRFCKLCWELHQYHCLFFDLAWVKRCPWHGTEILRPGLQCKPARDNEVMQDEIDDCSFDGLLASLPMDIANRHKVTGLVLEYLEWWRAVQAKVPAADVLLQRLVTTREIQVRERLELEWQAGFAQEQVPVDYGSWVLQDTQPKASRYVRLIDTGRKSGAVDDRTTIRDDTGRCYRAIRRHIFRNYVRQHRRCLSKLAKLDQEDLRSLGRSGVCVTCLAYVVWRMRTESLIIMKGLFVSRTSNYELRMTEPWAHSPSDDATRLSFTYMQFFGLWAAMVDCLGRGGVKVSMQEIVITPQVVFAQDKSHPIDSPLRTLHCLCPDASSLAIRSGRPCKASWNLVPSERQCVQRTWEWLNTLRPSEPSLFEIWLENSPDAVAKLHQLWT